MENQTLLKKLFEIQKSIKTFAAEENSDKTGPDGKPSYRYTPGWKITETIRNEMDSRKIMLRMNCKSQDSKLIEYLVYKDFHGQAMSFAKKEMFVQVTAEFTWVDVDTGETDGPYIHIGYGANGTDKSGATALSMAKRYFLMNYFNFTTREAADEQDAHDSGNIPGIASGEGSPQNLSATRSAQAVPAPAPYSGMPQPAQPVAPGFIQPVICPAAPGFGSYQPAPAGTIPAGFQAAPAPAPGPAYPPTPNGEFNNADPNIQRVITQLMNFEKGTASHQRCLNEAVGQLSSMGYQCTANGFIDKLVDTANALRHGKKTTK